jgi:hypothetical protein
MPIKVHQGKNIDVSNGLTRQHLSIRKFSFFFFFFGSELMIIFKSLWGLILKSIKNQNLQTLSILLIIPSFFFPDLEKRQKGYFFFFKTS